MSFFRPDEKKSDTVEVSTSLGRAITSIDKAKRELFVDVDRIDPVNFISEAAKKNKNYYGFFHGKNDPFFLKDNQTTMEIYVGSTGTGKGVLLGNRALEAIKKRKGVIIIDPKKDTFLPQICKEELTKQGRADDFQVVSWSQNFGYDGINEDDDYIGVANKLIDAFDWVESDNPGVDYYRKKQRILLKKVLKVFFEGSIGKKVKKDLNEIAKHIIFLSKDLQNQSKLEQLLEKSSRGGGGNFAKMEKLQKRYFDIDLVLKFFDDDDIETLKSIAESFDEFVFSANIFKKYDLKGALYSGKVIYFKVDMLDISSLKMVKLMINDAIQQSRNRRADTIVIADELSFYANKTIAGALATVRSMGLKFLLALQDLAQMKDESIRNAILSNCNVKLFYKISDKTTLEYVEKIGGVELVTKYSNNEKGGSILSQDQENFLNVTKIRALPRAGTAIVVAEALPNPIIINTNFVAVTQEFNWDSYDNINSVTFSFSKDKKEEDNFSFETKLKEAKKILDNSDLLVFDFDTEAI